MMCELVTSLLELPPCGSVPRHAVKDHAMLGNMAVSGMQAEMRSCRTRLHCTKCMTVSVPLFCFYSKVNTRLCCQQGLCNSTAASLTLKVACSALTKAKGNLEVWC